MLELKDGFVLYHGSYCEVKEPNLAKCAKRKDFGQGFYLTSSKEQAESFLRTSIVKAIATGTIEEGQNFGYISTFEFKLFGKLETHIFENADMSWLHCIAAHRKKKMFIEVEREMEKYDIIAGKIADDATNVTLTAYLAGAFGNYMNPVSACRIGMIPPVLLDRIETIGNAAGEGAKLCALNRREFAYSQFLAAKTEFLELASCPEFQDCYIDHLMFGEE